VGGEGICNCRNPSTCNNQRCWGEFPAPQITSMMSSTCDSTGQVGDKTPILASDLSVAVGIGFHGWIVHKRT
jgi:hypothetical protein